jgi:hypothetical protein
MECRPSGVDHAYLWVTGIHPGEGKLCLLVMIGVPATRATSWPPLADDYRESFRADP